MGKANDFGTAELSHRHELRPELCGQTAGLSLRMKVLDEKAIDKLLLSDAITLAEHHIANDWLKDLHPVASFPVLNMDRVHSAALAKDSSPAWTRAIHKLSFIYRRMDADIGEDARKAAVRCLVQDDLPEGTALEFFRASLISYHQIMADWRR